jgi:hypothetical protein
MVSHDEANVTNGKAVVTNGEVAVKFALFNATSTNSDWHLPTGFFRLQQHSQAHPYLTAAQLLIGHKNFLEKR